MRETSTSICWYLFLAKLKMVQFKCKVLLKMEILQLREKKNVWKKTYYVFDVD